MTVPAVTAGEVVDVVERFAGEFSDDPRPAAIAIAAQPVWDGPESLTVGGIEFSVIPAPSVLAVRAALTEAEGPLVLLTPCVKSELGVDVCARLAGQRPRNTDRREAVARLFGAPRIDPRLLNERWLTDELLAIAPSGGFARVGGGVLTLEHAVGVLAEQHLGLVDLQPLPAALLEWADEPGARQRVRQAPTHLVERVFDDWLAKSVPFSSVLLSAMRAGSDDLVALGLVAGVVGSADGPQAVAAATLFRNHIEKKPLESAVGKAWGDASAVVLAGRIEDGVNVDATLASAEHLLDEFEAKELAADDVYLRSSFRARLEAYGAALEAALANDELVESAQHAARRVDEHRLSSVQSGRARRVAMSARLLRWLAFEPEIAAGTLAEAGSHYRDVVAWADYAHHSLSEPEGIAELESAYQLLRKAVDLRRSAFNKRFAEILAGWDQGLSPSLIPIEAILDEVVVPIAAVRPVLLLVLDGMGWPVWHELYSDFAQRGWTRVAPADETEPERPAVAVFPTVTEHSRTSLLCGRLAPGGSQADEKREFPKHPGLSSVSKPSKPPAIFHKGELTRADGGGLEPGLAEIISDTDRRVVACVVNAIDDHLLKGDQVPHDWTIDGIRPLDLLLDLAQFAGRAVVVTADHGHILDRDTEARVVSGARERWRPNDGNVGADEVVISGPRTLSGDGTVIMPWKEQLRYSAGRRNGYHGGATPQEVLVPIDVLVAGAPPENWVIASRRRPTWWSPLLPRVQEPKSVEEVSPREFGPEAGQPSLFEGEDESATHWIARILESDLMSRQRERIGARAPEADRVQDLLIVLATTAHPLSHTEVADAINYPEQRIRGLLAAAARLLNVDGYPVLEDDGSVVRFDEELAKTQFGVS